MLQQRITIINLIKLTVAISVFVYLFFLFFHTDWAMTQDLGRHLSLGKIIWESESVPKSNLFSYTHPDFPFVNHHWGAEVIFYLLVESFGVNILIWLKTVFILTSFFLIFIYAVRRAGFASLIAFSYLALQLIRERTDVRPEIFGYMLFCILQLIFYQEIDRKGKLIYVIPLIILFWVNLHISFVFGFVLYALFCLDRIVSKKFQSRYLLVGILTAVAGLLNPYGLSGLMYPFRIFANYGYSIVENQSPFFLETVIVNQNILFFKVSLFLAVFVMPVLLAKKMFFGVFSVIVFAALSAQAIRHFPFFGLVFILPLALGIKELIKIVNLQGKEVLKTARILYIIYLLLWQIIFLFQIRNLFSNSYYIQKASLSITGAGYVKGMEGAVDYFLDKNLKGPIFNNFDIGSYLIYRLYPGEKVFVDGRPEAYPSDFFQKIYIPMQEDERIWQEMEKRYGFNTVLISHTDMTPWGRRFIVSILKNPGWQLDYFDGFGLVLTKKKLLPGETDNDMRPSGQEKHSIRIQREISIKNPDPAERRFWENFLNLARMSEN